MTIYSLIIVGVVLMMIFWLRQKIIHMYNKEFFWQLTFFVTLFSLIGAKISHVIHESYFYSIRPQDILSTNGFSILGAILFGTITLFFLSIVYKANFDHLADRIFLILPLAQGIGRLANILNNELMPHAEYEMIFNFFNFSIVYFLYKFIRKDGLVTAVYFMNYGFFRLAIEYDKGDLIRFLSLISFVFFVYGLMKLIKIIFKL